MLLCARRALKITSGCTIKDGPLEMSSFCVEGDGACFFGVPATSSFVCGIFKRWFV